MTYREIMKASPHRSLRANVETWLTYVGKEAGRYAGSAMAEFGARWDAKAREADVSHLTEYEVAAIRDYALRLA